MQRQLRWLAQMAWHKRLTSADSGGLVLGEPPTAPRTCKVESHVAPHQARYSGRFPKQCSPVPNGKSAMKAAGPLKEHEWRTVAACGRNTSMHHVMLGAWPYSEESTRRVSEATGRTSGPGKLLQTLPPMSGGGHREAKARTARHQGCMIEAGGTSRKRHRRWRNLDTSTMRSGHGPESHNSGA